MCAAAAQRGHIFQDPDQAAIVAPIGWSDSVTQTRYEGEWPAGVWIGTSVENQKYAPATSRYWRNCRRRYSFVSAEPLLAAGRPQSLDVMPATATVGLIANPRDLNGGRETDGHGLGKSSARPIPAGRGRCLLPQAAGRSDASNSIRETSAKQCMDGRRLARVSQSKRKNPSMPPKTTTMGSGAAYQGETLGP